MVSTKLTIRSLFFLSVILVPQLSKAQWGEKWQSDLPQFFNFDESTAGEGVTRGSFRGQSVSDILVWGIQGFTVHNGLTGVLEFAVDSGRNNALLAPPLVADIDDDGRDEIVVSFTDRGVIAYEFGGTVGVNEPEQSNIPKSSKLFQNYPNPFNPETEIEYSLNRSGSVQILIFNQLGQRVRTLVDEPNAQPGNYSVTWDGKGDNSRTLASGTYYYQIKTNNFVSTKKAIFLK